MKLTPRGPEVKHVVAAIDQEHASATAAAKAAIKAVTEALDFREWFVIDDGGLLWGLFASEKDAEKGLALIQSNGVMRDARVLPLRSTARMRARTNGIPLDEDCECGHENYMHQFEASSRGKCGWSSCDCKKFKKSSHPMPTYPTCMTCKQPVIA